LELHRQNRLDEAEKLYRKLLALDNGNADVFNLLGALFLQKGKPQKAATFLKKAIAQAPKNASFHSNLAKAQLSSNEIDKAIEAYERSLELEPDSEENLNSLGALYLEKGEVDKALNSFENALKTNPTLAEAYFNQGNALSFQRNYKEAIESYEKAISLKQDYFKAHNNKGNALKELGLFDDAIESYQKALTLKPDFYDAYLNIGNAFSAAGAPEKALEYYEKMEAISPALPAIHINKGNALKQCGRKEEALACFRKAIELAPENTDAHLNYGMSLLLYENFNEGWPEYEWRLNKKELQSAKLNAPKWDGSSAPEKSLLIIAEQGFGDAIQSARYFPIAKKLCGKVIFSCRKPLIPLMKNPAGIDEIIQPEEIETSNFDIYIPNMSLPGIFNADLSNIPSVAPYIHADKDKVAEWKSRIKNDKKFKIGLCWAGSPTNTNDRNRSTSFKFMKELISSVNADFYSLQKGSAPTDCADNFFDFTENFNDFSDTAALMEYLDLTISVDTAIAHLAGAMNKPVWLMLPFEPEWRWLTKREDSPWYPSMRIFRQKSFNDWAGLISQIKTELEKKTKV
jgi:tetratricopeptide (TPR) repeat protein